MLLFPKPMKDASARAGPQRTGPDARGVGVFRRAPDSLRESRDR